MSHAIVCEDVNLERKVLIKSLQDGIDPGRLLDELSALLEIRSKHVVQIYDVILGKDGNVAAIVEEYLPGKDLSSLSAPASADAALRLLYPIAEGISDIHAHNRIHRDIKPINMKYDAEGCLKIFDFGLARIDGIDASTIGIVGTPGYIAPELFLADAHGKVEFTKAVDTFAFGASALRLLSGKLPPQLRKLPPTLGGPALDFASLPIGLPANVAAVLTACLSNNPAARPMMNDVKKTIASHLLKGRHRALLVHGSQKYEISSAKTKTSAKISSAGKGGLEITYDGFNFVISNISGDVYVNNSPAVNGSNLPGACVIVLGSPALGYQRVSITMDVSHPEVTL